MGLIFSRKYFISSLLLFLNWNFLQVSAIIPQERGDQDCVFMPTVAKIYCYGGQYYSSVTDALSNTAVMDTLFISLDLTEQRTVADLQNAWERVDRDIGPNSFFGFAGLPNHNIIFMDGGAGGIDGGRTKVRYKSATFDIEPNNDWSSVTPERPGTPVNGHKATLGPDNSTIYVWGGLRNNETGVAMGEDTHPLSMYIFDITNTQSPWTTGPAAPESYQYHAAVLVDSSIYYTGGTYRTPSGLIDYVPMNIVRIYDTSNGQWSTHPITGSVIPTTRVRHTTTLKPSTGEVILFGGRGADDYFYVLDRQGDNWTWRNGTIQQTGDVFDAQRIFAHSAVLIGNQLYIMFGFKADGINFNISLNRTWIMDISANDFNQWAWVSTADAVQPVELPSPTRSPNPTDGPGDGSVNGGTIAGAVVGSVVGVAIIAGVAFFFIRRKRGQPQQQQEVKQEYNDGGRGQYGMYPSYQHPPPPANYREPLDQGNNDNNGVRQPLSPSTNYSQGTGDMERYSTTDYTNTSTLQGHLSTTGGFHSPEKPDGAVQRLVLTPVKPDGV